MMPAPQRWSKLPRYISMYKYTSFILRYTESTKLTLVLEHPRKLCTTLPVLSSLLYNVPFIYLFQSLLFISVPKTRHPIRDPDSFFQPSFCCMHKCASGV